ncbi:MAG: hypothetical protein MZW92_49960 [Comamonadaceae bacterium]|nr:hypothetical protein [Comamonadaceae bacterium]
MSVFFVGCGVTVYHGIHSLLHPADIEPFTPLGRRPAARALALESYTLSARRLEGDRGWLGFKENRLQHDGIGRAAEDAVALLGILLTLLVAGLSLVLGPHLELDARGFHRRRADAGSDGPVPRRASTAPCSSTSPMPD